MSKSKHENHELTIKVHDPKDPDCLQRCIKILSRELQKAGTMAEYQKHRHFITNQQKRYQQEKIIEQRRRRKIAAAEKARKYKRG